MIGMEDVLRAYEAHAARAQAEYEQAYDEVLEEVDTYPEALHKVLDPEEAAYLLRAQLCETSFQSFLAQRQAIFDRAIDRLVRKRLDS